MKNAVIISRHRGAIDWLAQQGITGTVVAHATKDDVLGKDVVGNLPLDLAALANTVTSILMTVPADMRGKDLTADDMVKMGARLQMFKVTAL